MELKDNPLLQPEDFTAGYKESMENLKNNPELIAFDKLTYELFSSELGKRWMEVVVDRYLIPPMADRNSPNFPNSAVWGEGFKDFPRMLRMCILSHSQRIKAGESK